MNIQEILDLYDKTAFLPFGMAELLLEREAELVQTSKEVPAPSCKEREEVAESPHRKSSDATTRYAPTKTNLNGFCDVT